MLDTIREYIKNFFESRLLPVAVVFVLLFCILVNRLFQLQISETDTYSSQTTQLTESTREIKASRGNIYDCNGTLLAYNKLSYNVTYEENDNNADLTSEEKNTLIYQLLQILEKEGDSLSVEFYIEFNKKGVPQFTISGNTLLRFKAEVFSTTVSELNQEQQDMTAQEIYDFLRYDTGTTSPQFAIGEEYDDETALQIMAVRYAMYINRYHKYQAITLAKNVDDKTVAAIKENSSEMPGVDIEEDTTRVYKKSKYFSHILGYTGAVTSEKLEELQEEDPDTPYTTSDQIGISGLESTYEEYLCGTKGSEKLEINESTSRVESVTKEEDPVAGNDLYLTIDADLQEECYKLLEEHIAGILVSNINNSHSAGSKGQSTSKIKIPIYDVYSALFTNNIIDSSRFTDKDASSLEKSTYKKYKKASKTMKRNMRKILAADSKKTASEMSDAMEEFIDYFYKILKNEGVILTDEVEESDETFKKYTSDKISLSKFLQYAISQNWVDLSLLDIGEEYFSTEEIYEKLVDYGMDLLDSDTTYPKMIYSYLIDQEQLSGRDCCLLLFDQGDIEYNEEEYTKLKTGITSPYSFIIRKIKKLEITPGELGLEPCSGSLIVTDMNGDVKAMVSYPSYDNNKMANQVDSDYFYNYLTQASSSPLLNHATQQLLAPGSTFKIVSAVAGLEENIISTKTTIYDHVKFTQINPSPSCWSSSGHGNLTVSSAIEVSCNYFFYSVGFKLGNGNASGSVNDTKGLKRLKKYAEMFGLTDKSGVEITESEPNFSDTDIVRSAIGQATHAYAPIQIARYVTTVANDGTCYNLTLVDKITDVNGDTVLNNEAEVRNTVDISDSTWNAIHKGMYLVTNGSNSSTTSLYSNLNVTVAGKTGTAQVNTYHANHAYFMSYAPYDDPEIAVTCVIPNGYASSNAAQTARDVYKYYFSKNKKNVSGSIKMPESQVNQVD